MSSIWDKICELFLTLVRPTRRKTRVHFSPSTLHREIMRHSKLKAHVNPFFNFLADIRMQARTRGVQSSNMSLHETVLLTKTAGRMWSLMSDEQKQPYRNIALEQRKLKRLQRRRRRRRFSIHSVRRKKPVVTAGTDITSVSNLS